MNKTESVSIGRRPFVCEIDAYVLLQAYLERSKKRLAHDPDRVEILADLEHAMASHLTEKCKDLVVDKASAEAVVTLMGEVELRDQRELPEEKDTPNTTSFTERLGLLFKRNPQKDRSRAIIEGVCAGIAKLLMIDPFWVRMVFITFTILSQGLGILLYIVLALIMHDEHDDYAGKTAGEVVGTVKERAKVGFSQNARRYEQILSLLIRRIFSALSLIANVALLLALIALGALWSTLIFFMIANPNRIVLFGENPSVVDFMALVSIGMVLLIPILLLIMQLAGSHLVRNVRSNVIFGCLWVISILLAAGSAINVVPNIRDRLVREAPTTKNVVVEVADGQIVHSCFTLWGDCRENQPNVYTGTVCGKQVSMIEMTDASLMRMQSWSWIYQTKDIAYPISEEAYCEFVIMSLQAHSPDRVVFIDQAWNDELYQQTITTQSDCDGVSLPEQSALNKEEPVNNRANTDLIRPAADRSNGSAMDMPLDQDDPSNCVPAVQKVWQAIYFTR